MTHWPSKWFEIRSEMGQSDLATIMFQDIGKPFEKHHFRHREADGFGKILSLIKRAGIDVSAPIRKIKKPSRYLNYYLLVKGLLTHPRLPENPWKYFFEDRESGHPDQVSWLFFSNEENQYLKKMAVEKKLNLSFFLLSELDEIIKKHLFKNPHDDGTWLTPVDVRGAYPDAEIDHNYVSFIATKIQTQKIPEAFVKYKNDLRTGAYWPFWELAQIGQYVGLKGMRWLVKQGIGKSFWMGSFSDLGIWNQPELQNSSIRHRYWCIAPPGSLAYPIGMTTIEWCGNRSLTMKIHPAVCVGNSKDLSDLILKEFKEKILKTVSKSD